MKVIHGIKNIHQKFKRPVLTLGIFDGVHLAHQRIIKEVVRRAKVLQGTSVVLTFDYCPWRIVKRNRTLPLITSLERRIALLEQLNVDVCIVVELDKQFAGIYAQDFIRDILVKALNLTCIIVGADFRFGKDRQGDFSLLKKFAHQYGFKAYRIKTVKLGGQIVSSSRIRSLIQQGRIEQANRLLGRRFSILGRVSRGKARGRILGYPTANIQPEEGLLPPQGVYAVFIKLNHKLYPGILNIGVRPTFGPEKKSPPTIEVHIFDFCNTIYDKGLEVFFVQRIRPERKFTSPQTLLARIKKDELRAKEILHSELLT